MRCPECGANGYSRKTRTPEWRCRRCGHEWDVVPDSPVPDNPSPLSDSENDVSEQLDGKPTGPNVVQHSLNLIMWPVIFLIVAVFIFYALSPINIVLAEFLGRAFSIAFTIFRVVTAICAGLYIASRVFSDVTRRINENDW